MRKLLVLLTMCMGLSIALEAAPPKLMLLPSLAWCNDNGCVDITTRNGKERRRENYDKAFLNQKLDAVEKEFKSFMNSDGRSFPVLSYLEATSNSDDEDALDEMYEGAESGSGVGGSAFEDIMAAKGDAPDIYIKVNWSVDNIGLKKTITYSVDAVDAYSTKSVATITGTTAPVSQSTPDHILLMQGLRDQLSDFEGRLQNHFDDIQKNGREISLRLRMIDNGSGMKFTDEYGGKELGTIITDWVSDNTVNHQFTEKNSSRNAMSYDQVRVPIYDEYNRPQQAKQWVTKLQNYLRDNYNIKAENNSTGLGTGRLYIGEK